MLNTPLYPYQREGVKQIQRFGGRALLADEMGLGKAQPVGSLVATPDGWTPIGRLAVGDLVIGSDGKPTAVTGVFPQGVLPTFRVTFRDGASTVCCDDHLWAVRSPGEKHRGCGFRVAPLREIRKQIVDGAGNCIHHVPIVRPVEYAPRPVPLDPYLVGYLIANGSLTTNSPAVTAPDAETADRVAPMLPPSVAMAQTADLITYRLSVPNGHGSLNPLTEILRDLSLMGKTCYEKEIPAAYAVNTVAVRVALLQGLMDGDGTTSKDGMTTEYTTTSPTLAKQVRDLVWSLGGTCRRSEKTPTFHHRGEKKTGRRAYTLRLSLPADVVPFRLSRKLQRYTPRTKYPPSRAITAVEPAGDAECVCISVAAADRLYVTDDFVVTHNTLQALYWAWKYLSDVPGPVVVVCPASIKFNWARQALQHLELRAEVLSGQAVPDGYFPSDPNQLYVINYDILTQPRTDKRARDRGRDWASYLNALGPKLVIGDECHYIKSNTALRSRAFRRLCKGVDHVIMLSGTPLTNKPTDLWPMLNILLPVEYPQFFPFACAYTHTFKAPWGAWAHKGARQLDQLHEILKTQCMIRRTKAEVMAELPPITRTLVPIEVDLSEYRRAEADFIGWLDAQSGGLSARAAKAVELTKMNELRRLVGRLKMDGVVRWVRDLFDQTDEKLLLGLTHKRVSRPLLEALADVGAVLVDGESSERHKIAAFDRFNLDPACRLLIGNTQAAGVGWSCTSTSTVALCEFPWTPGEAIQFEARVHGQGRGRAGRPVNAYYLYVDETIEADLVSMLEEKSRWVDATLDGDARGGGLSIVDQVKSLMRNRVEGR